MPARREGADRRGPRLPLPGGDYVAVSVADTGIGMDAATLARAVEPFFTTKPVGKGTGLGLASVQDLARLTQGALRLISELGHGTIVELWLPRAQTAAGQLGLDQTEADYPLRAGNGAAGWPERADLVVTT
jgi:signal transduction histidine kinase